MFKPFGDYPLLETDTPQTLLHCGNGKKETNLVHPMITV